MELFENNKYFSLSLDEIYSIVNLAEREYAIEFYKRELLNLGNDRLTKRVLNDNLGKSIEEIITKLEDVFLSKRSDYTFPDDIVLFYPAIKECRAASDIICDVTGAEIKKGNFYYSYRPLLENISNEHVYVLNRSIKTEISELDFLPTSIYEFDSLSEKIDNAYDIIDEDYDYYGISRRIGGSLRLRKIR